MVSHTTTGEWQSFELRMRRRRAERLLLRAEAAMDAECFEDAQQCLAEARALEPGLPGIDALQQKLSTPLPEVQHEATPRRLAPAAAVLLLTGTAVVGAWMVVPRMGATVEPVIAAPQPSAANTPAPAAAAPLPPPADVFASETTPAARSNAGEVIPSPPEPAAASVPSVAAAPALRQVPLSEIASSLPLRTPAPEATPAPPVLPPAPEPAAVTALTLPAAAVLTPPAAAEPIREPSQEPAVRSVLDRYAAAYSALDVDAAQRVWPAVNRGALARAFDSLASQDVSLGDCRIDVIGINATARCAGTTSWSVKVGDGGRHAEARSWTFELARGAAGWEIVSARVQNR